MTSFGIKFLSLLLVVAVSSAHKHAQVWMGLERLNEDIAKDLQTIQSHSTSLSSVSYEQYNIGPGGQFVKDPLTNVAPSLKKMGLKTYPMISSYPHTNETMGYIRELISNDKNVDSFIEKAINTALQDGVDGINLDMEPTGSHDASEKDGQLYTLFVEKFSQRMQHVGLELQVDIASWSSLWDFPALAKACPTCPMLTMGTYASTFDTFKAMLEHGVNIIGKSLCPGLAGWNLGNGVPFTPEELKERFDLLNSYNITCGSVWVMPLPDSFWVAFDQWVAT